jgi:hypothetical protein
MPKKEDSIKSILDYLSQPSAVPKKKKKKKEDEEEEEE